MENAKPITTSFLATIARSDLKNVTIDLTEVALDNMLESGILKDIPVIGSIVGFFKGVVAIREQMFIKRVAIFLTFLSGIPAQEREEMFLKLEKKVIRDRKLAKQCFLY